MGSDRCSGAPGAMADSHACVHTCTGDIDDGSGTGLCDDARTIDDLLYSLLLFERGAARADFDDGSGLGTPDGAVPIDDLLRYLHIFADGSR